MKILQKRYFYYIVYEVQKSGRAVERNAIELELRNPITSIVHCEAIADYIAETLEKDGPKSSKKNTSVRKKAIKKTARKAVETRVLVLSFTFLRSRRSLFAGK